MIALERRKRIYELALQKGAVGVAELASLLDAAENTIRADLSYLENEGKLIRSRGGAVLRESAQPMPPYQQVRDANMLSKSWIAEAALAYIPQSGSVFINAGTTAHQLAIRIPDSSAIDLFTNSPDIAMYLASNKHLPVSLIGGRMVQESMETDGSFSRDLLGNIYWDAAFIGITALDIEHGITSINIACARMEASIIDNSRLAVGLCDSSKLGKFSRVRSCDINKLDVLITDTDADPRLLGKITDLGVRVITAGELSDSISSSPELRDITK